MWLQSAATGELLESRTVVVAEVLLFPGPADPDGLCAPRIVRADDYADAAGTAAFVSPRRLLRHLVLVRHFSAATAKAAADALALETRR